MNEEVAYMRFLNKVYAEVSAIDDKDPDLALANIRFLCDYAEADEDYDRLIYWVRYLDVHLREGGNLPKGWQR